MKLHICFVYSWFRSSHYRHTPNQATAWQLAPQRVSQACLDEVAHLLIVQRVQVQQLLERGNDFHGGGPQLVVVRVVRLQQETRWDGGLMPNFPLRQATLRNNQSETRWNG